MRDGESMTIRNSSLKRFLIIIIITTAFLSFPRLIAAAQEGANATIPFEAGTLIIEFNSTAQDVGVQLFLDSDEAWKNIKVFDPNGNLIFEVDGRGKLRNLGVTELFFESDEPSLEDQPLDKLFAKFPEGDYKFVGRTVEGNTLLKMVPFSHNIPDGPSVVSPKRNATVDPRKTKITWDPVVTPAGIQIVSYQLIVEREHPHREFSVFVPGTTTSVTVSHEFLQAGTKYKFEILAIDVSGNQTITEGHFKTQ
jgi:hypothetical protein